MRGLGGRVCALHLHVGRDGDDGEVAVDGGAVDHQLVVRSDRRRPVPVGRVVRRVPLALGNGHREALARAQDGEAIGVAREQAATDLVLLLVRLGHASRTDKGVVERLVHVEALEARELGRVGHRGAWGEAHAHVAFVLGVGVARVAVAHAEAAVQVAGVLARARRREEGHQ